MKKNISKNLLLALLFIVPTILFSSCDDDDNNGHLDAIAMSQTLNGTWAGNLTASGTDYNGNSGTNFYYTIITFAQSYPNATYGTGQQVDYDKSGGSEVMSRTFSWSINSVTGDIIITYSNEYVMTIYYDALRLTNKEFSGIMRGNNETDVFTFTYGT